MMRLVFTALLILGMRAHGADIYTFTVPAGVNVATSDGSTVTGWGYSLRNESSSLWLVTQRLSAQTFQYASPEGIFDFPDIAPGASATVPFNFGSSTGLYQIRWDSSVPAGFTNLGSFLLEAQWWSGNPLDGGTFVTQAPDTSQAYSASLTPVPEPGTLGPGVICLAILFGILRRRRVLPRRG